MLHLYFYFEMLQDVSEKKIQIFVAHSGNGSAALVLPWLFNSMQLLQM
jgi:hypothetical protein